MGVRDHELDPSNTPASRSLRHSTTWEEYNPSRRKYAPPSFSVQASS
jgi:hypothetical protein